jgi:hypothetical protein
MKSYIFNSLAVLVIIFNIQTFKAQSLIAGDIAFIGMNTDTKEGFSFISLVDIPGNEKIFFSDRSIIDMGRYISNVEGTFLFTAPTEGIPLGTIVSFKENTTNIYTITGVTGANIDIIEGIANLVAGDQIYAYQTANNLKSDVPSDATFIAGIMSDYDQECIHTTNRWTMSSCVSNTSECMIPPGLTNGLDCVSISLSNTLSENMKYIGSLDGDVMAIRLLINNVANWESNTSTVLDISAAGYETPSIDSSGHVLSNTEHELETNVKIYPNPSKNTLNIEGITKDTKYKIFNILGNKIMEGKFNILNTINISELSQGMYFIKLKNHSTIKFLKY